MCNFRLTIVQNEDFGSDFGNFERPKCGLFVWPSSKMEILEAILAILGDQNVDFSFDSGPKWRFWTRFWKIQKNDFGLLSPQNIFFQNRGRSRCGHWGDLSIGAIKMVGHRGGFFWHFEKLWKITKNYQNVHFSLENKGKTHFQGAKNK